LQLQLFLHNANIPVLSFAYARGFSETVYKVNKNNDFY